MKGGRRQGRQGKRWEDNFRERTGLEFGKSKRAVENREKWKKMVVKSSVVPKRPSRLMMMIYTVERTNATEIRPDEQNEKAESCRENVWNEIQSKGP